MRHLEHREQAEVVHWLRAAGILYCSVPNGARTSLSVAKRLKAEGLSAGAPDLLIFDPPPKFPKFIGVAIELKRPDGKGRVTDAQKDWLMGLYNRGWATKVCAGAVEALAWLSGLGYRVPG